MAGLDPGTTYNVTAEAYVAGKPAPLSNIVVVTTSPVGAPVLTSAVDTGSGSARAAGLPPPGVTLAEVCRGWWELGSGWGAVSVHG